MVGFKTVGGMPRNGIAGYMVVAISIASVFVCDLIVPSANLAIGYCAVPLLGAIGRNRRVLLAIIVLCTALTWIGLFIEMPFSQLKTVPVVDRMLVTGAIWLIWLLVEQRAGDASPRREMRVAGIGNSRIDAIEHRPSKFLLRRGARPRGPLNSINMAADLLKIMSQENNDAEGEKWTVVIQSQVERMSELIQSLLDYAQCRRRFASHSAVRLPGDRCRSG